jgi:hypothetical protein
LSIAKQKGTRFENQIRDRLNSIDGVVSHRVLGSGAYANGDADSEFFGDVRAETRVGEIIFEAKWRSTSGWKTLEKWMGDHDALVVKSPHEPVFVFMPWDLFAKLLEGGDIIEPPKPLRDSDLRDLCKLIEDFIDERIKTQQE